MKIALGYVMYKRRLNSYQMSFANVRFVEIMIIILFSNECLASVASGSLLPFFQMWKMFWILQLIHTINLNRWFITCANAHGN